MNLVSTFAPNSFLKPVIVISTIFKLNSKETAVCFVEALNGNHALKVLFSDHTEPTEKSEYVKIKSHRTIQEAVKFHTEISKKMRNGCSESNWNKGMKIYNPLYEKYCPASMKKS